MKKINRNAFNEKIIHRYLFERLYFGGKKAIKKLLPERLHNYNINLIEPESNKGDYRADLNIYFKNKDNSTPIEVKWNSNSKIGNNQLKYLKKNSGVILSFDDSDDSKFNGVDHISIDVKDFKSWMKHNISKLTRESLIYQADIKDNLNTNQFWVVMLRGTAHKNWDRMINEFPKKSFWAFQQHREAIKNIFNIQKGDKCLFIKGIANEGMSMSRNPKLNFQYNGWYLTTVKEPYYMALDNSKGTFFEKENPPINKRRWPHFIDFEITESFDCKNYDVKKMNYGKRNDLCDPLANSANYGSGTPSPLTINQWESTLDKLNSQKEDLKSLLIKTAK